jgi:hypothetical protein
MIEELRTEELRVGSKEYVERWKRVEPRLEAQREEDVRQSDTMGAFAFFCGYAIG